jgi:hypothetical protein
VHQIAIELGQWVKLPDYDRLILTTQNECRIIYSFSQYASGFVIQKGQDVVFPPETAEGQCSASLRLRHVVGCGSCLRLKALCITDAR